MTQIMPRDFFGENLPSRIIGTETEYNVQVTPGYDHSGYKVLQNMSNPDLLRDYGFANSHGYLSNGGRIYIDVGHLEYDTPECLGPLQAAAADTAGIQIISSLGAATEGVSGVYRLGGSYIPRKQPLTLPYQNTGFSSGYHANFAIPVGAIPREDSAAHILSSFLLSRIWAGAGMVRDGFVYSQKTWGIDFANLQYNSKLHAVSHGQKPMAVIYDDHNDDTLHSPGWGRLEIRSGDPHMSPSNTYLDLAVTSLMLRLFEHKDRIRYDRLAAWSFPEENKAAELFACDLTLRQAWKTRDGEHYMTALNAQEMYLEEAELLLSGPHAIELPDDELRALGYWRRVIDGLRASNPSKAEYSVDALVLTDFAAKHRALMNKVGQTALQENTAEAKQIDMIWNRVFQPGISRAYWEAMDTGAVQEQAVAEYLQSPPPTRAALRSDIISTYEGFLGGITWSQYVLREQDFDDGPLMNVHVIAKDAWANAETQNAPKK